MGYNTSHIGYIFSWSNGAIVLIFIYDDDVSSDDEVLKSKSSVRKIKR